MILVQRPKRIAKVEMDAGESDRLIEIAGRGLRHPQLVEEKGNDVGIFRDAFGEGGAHAVARGGAEMHEDRVGGGVGLLQPGGHFARIRRTDPAVVLACQQQDSGIVRAVAHLVIGLLRRVKPRTVIKFMPGFSG
jgi:hypothetical protein